MHSTSPTSDLAFPLSDFDLHIIEYRLVTSQKKGTASQLRTSSAVDQIRILVFNVTTNGLLGHNIICICSKENYSWHTLIVNPAPIHVLRQGILRAVCQLSTLLPNRRFTLVGFRNPRRCVTSLNQHLSLLKCRPEICYGTIESIMICPIRGLWKGCQAFDGPVKLLCLRKGIWNEVKPYTLTCTVNQSYQ